MENKCKWCADGNTPILVDQDGVNCLISKKPGRFNHCYEDMFWLCGNNHDFMLISIQNEYAPLKSELDRLKQENGKLQQNQAKLKEALKPFAEWEQVLEDINYVDDKRHWFTRASQTMKEVCGEEKK